MALSHCGQQQDQKQKSNPVSSWEPNNKFNPAEQPQHEQQSQNGYQDVFSREEFQSSFSSGLLARDVPIGLVTGRKPFRVVRCL
jgi:hypothetical protein